MTRPVIQLTSVTYAVRAQKLLEQNGIRSYIKKLSKNVSANGCGYGLEVAGDLHQAIQLLDSNGIRIVEVTGGDVI